MKNKIITSIVLVAMLLNIVSSASASPVPASTAISQSTQQPGQNVVARVYFTSQEDLNSLAARHDILEINHEQSYALMILSPQAFSALQQAGYHLEIDESKTKLLNKPWVALPGQGPDSIPGFPCYRTVEETYADIQTLVDTHPGMAELIDIGDSWDKDTGGGNPGYDILAIRLTNEDPQFGDVSAKPTFFLMAEIHARELTTAETAMRYAEYLINNYGIDPDITWLLDYFKVYIVTMTNPDGRKKAEAGDYWRKNVDNDDGCNDPNSWGTDLNRNNAFHWMGGGSSPYPCDETYRGPSEGSEPETQAIENFIMTIFPDQRGPGDNDPAPDDTTGVFITLHSYARVVLYPWGWTSNPAPNKTDMQTLGRKFGFYNNYEVCQSNSNCMYPTNGTSDDWSYGTLGIASYTFELGVDFFETCGSFESTTYPENLPALVYALKAARRPYQNPAGPDSIDVSASPAAAMPGEPVLLAGTATDTRYNGGEPTQNIIGARYSIDSPSWITGTVTISMDPTDGNFNSTVEAIQANIDTSGLSAERHTIYVESQDAGNNWGVPTATFLYIVEPGVSPVIEGNVSDASTNLPVGASISAGLFNTTSDPATGYYSMTVISGTYDLIVEAENYAPAYANGVVAQNYQTVQQDFMLYPVCTIFTDDIENGNQGWTAQYPWAITTEASHSPAHSWTDSPGGQYFNFQDVKLTSQVFDLSGTTGVSLNFWHTYQTEPGYDYVNVEYDLGDNNWHTVATFDGSQPWTQDELYIPGLDGQPMARIRFRLTSDSSVTADGWHIDDIALNAGGSVCVPAVAPSADFTSNSPVILGQPMLFTNLTTGTQPITYTWDFGDGVGGSTEVDPSYTYTASGTYTVTLTATNEVDTSIISHPVTVEPLILKFFLPFTTK